MNSRILISLAIATSVAASVTAVTHAADSNYIAPRNEWGQPDLRGVWNFSSNTPLERPAAYADQEFFTDDDIAQIRARALREIEESDGNSSQGGVGGYNQFWIEGLPIEENRRTSLLIDPPNGRMPARVPGAPVAFGGLGPDSVGELPVRFTVGGIGKDHPEQRGLSERCLLGFNSVPPFMPSMYNNNVQLFQNEDHFVIFNEMIHEARIVPIDGRPRLPEDVKQWTGDSRGYWDGDTLVVETMNFTDKTQTFRGTGIGANMHLTERFTRVSDTEVHYTFTVNDPQAFVAPFTVLVPMLKMEEEIYEYACHEGNYGMVNILRGQRVEDGTYVDASGN
ncbi:MAG: hypothetical protein Q8L60_01885 [Gammaproteobacteria bacterium]|nr:hypothetical protein [Gammaproteobacteria bacterium]MDP2142401.1 hypothetical protein [Gammaproteobacteria bacterium]MDP2348642.1 hypothetical protein [Gammaproteobacteria bacterium]